MSSFIIGQVALNSLSGQSHTLDAGAWQMLPCLLSLSPKEEHCGEEAGGGGSVSLAAAATDAGVWPGGQEAGGDADTVQAMQSLQ